MVVAGTRTASSPSQQSQPLFLHQLAGWRTRKPHPMKYFCLKSLASADTCQVLWQAGSKDDLWLRARVKMMAPRSQLLDSLPWLCSA